MEENIYSKRCLECNNMYIGKGKSPGICPKCEEEIKNKEYFCNRCGQPMDYWEYNNSVEGYCEDCLEEEEEE